MRTLRVGRTSSAMAAFEKVTNRVLGINSAGEVDTSISLSGLEDAIKLARSLADNIDLAFPLDLGLVSDPIISNQYDLGSV